MGSTQKNTILLELINLSYHHLVRKVEVHPKALMADTSTKRQVVFRFEDGDHGTLDVDGDRLATEWRELTGYLASRWPGEFDSLE